MPCSTHGERFDGVRPASAPRRPARRDHGCADALDADIRAGLEESIRRLRQTCEAELEHTLVTDVAPGATVERRIVPMQRVGLYVPGGLAPLVSTVIMNAVPAQVAGVPGIALASPPQRRVRRPAAPHDPGGVRPARDRRGLRRRWRAGSRDVRLRRGGVPPGQPHHRPGQHLRCRGQALSAGHRQHRCRGRADRDRDHRR